MAVNGSEAAELAALLREVKQRSGLSYGILAKRLHTSTSTVHRYCNGDAVPADPTAVDRFAQVCRATPAEQTELRRRWELANLARTRKAEAQRTNQLAGGDVSRPSTEKTATQGITAETRPARPGPRRYRVPMLAAAVLAAVLFVTGLVVALKPGAAQGRSRATAAAPVGTDAPLSVTVRPYTWEDPCTPHYLVDRPPAQVPPPPREQDAAGWAGALGAVSADRQRVELTVQGTGDDTIVLQALHVRAVRTAAPLPWNNFAMAYRGIGGCGGGPVDVVTFDANLDSAQPAMTVRDGLPNFPYKASKSDPQQLVVVAQTHSHDVGWYLELEWSSGTRHGTLRIDDHGTPFRTSAALERPTYAYGLDDGHWGPPDN
ncbi:hypothetical protein AWN90_05225 [Nocardia terpenica]|uniref:HTH cro/C1-type domain-containing protein n=1 Tax=Nocardia terpenica TaxID=455432 RepID=A0A164J370_9NOCA|nr:hypothetical protein AWN90_05225 [Nocardia terpenica]